MSAHAHPRLVGAFVLGAIALILGAVVALSSGDWFAVRDRFSVFFPGSVKGLNPGAPVTFRGVKLGEVKEVSAILTGQEAQPVQIEVVLELFDRVAKVPQGVDSPFDTLDNVELAHELIRRGIRAKMLSASLVTGQRYIEMDFLPDEPARFGGVLPSHPELPTTPTAMEKLGARAEQFLDKLAELPLDEMLDDVRAGIRSAREVLGSEALMDALSAADRSFTSMEKLLEEARVAFGHADELVESLDAQVDSLGGDAKQTTEQLRATLQRAEDALGRMENTLVSADEAGVETVRTLEELSQTLAVMRNLVEYIQTHPEAVVLGKPAAEEKKK